jgi:AcrR family transcriptional regulator
MGRPKLAEGRDTRRALLDGALELFAEKGYFGTSLRDIARAVGVRESALYHYFSSKEALFQALLTERPEGLDRFERMLEGPVTDARVLLELVGNAALDEFATARQSKLFRILMSDGMRLAKEGRLNFLERTNPGRDFLPRLMEKLMREGWLRVSSAEMLALEFFAAFLVWRQIHAVRPDYPLLAQRDTFVRNHVDLFLRGAGAPRASNEGEKAP